MLNRLLDTAVRAMERTYVSEWQFVLGAVRASLLLSALLHSQPRTSASASHAVVLGG
jgi:hypothetical protein